MELTLLAKEVESGKDGCPSVWDIKEAPEDCVILGPSFDAGHLENVLPGEVALRIKKQVLIDALARLGL